MTMTAATTTMSPDGDNAVQQEPEVAMDSGISSSSSSKSNASSQSAEKQAPPSTSSMKMTKEELVDTTLKANGDEQEEAKNALVPQLSHHNITQADLQTAVKVLNAVASLHSSSSKKYSRKRQNNSNNAADDSAAAAAAAAPSLSGLDAYKHTNLRPLRKALASCLELHQQTMFCGQDEAAHYAERQKMRSLKRQKTAERDQHKKYIATTGLRQGRVERLQQLLLEQNDNDNDNDNGRDQEQAKMAIMSRMLMVPDGHVETKHTSSAPLRLEQGASTVTETPTEKDSKTSTTLSSVRQLPQLRSCYVCKVRFRELHSFYDQLCPACACLNWTKRHQTANMSGKVAVVTGGRVKIGYQTVLKLLRAGATVIATTRFPNAAAKNYQQEADFGAWCDRLHVFALDLRDVTGIEAFSRFLKQRFCDTGIDVLINNACQTVRRPVAYYAPLVQQEQALWQDGSVPHKTLLQGCVEFERVRRQLDVNHNNHQNPHPNHSAHALTAGETLALLPEPMVQEEDDSKPCAISASATMVASSSSACTTVLSTNDIQDDDNNKTIPAAPFESTGMSHAAAMSQTILLPDDAGVSHDVLPPGVTDINGQQLDLRTQNSWLLKMENVSTPEVMECLLINAIAPFVLNSRLKPLMTVPIDDDKRPDRYIINVSAMEGKFYRYKMPNHPHTNMAKAALNMLTRTSAEDLAKKNRIYMNSVDTGWINDENPLEKAKKIAETNLFQTPIDEIDAAARILDPVFSGINGGPDFQKDYGKFLKDYRESEW